MIMCRDTGTRKLGGWPGWSPMIWRYLYRSFLRMSRTLSVPSTPCQPAITEMIEVPRTEESTCESAETPIPLPHFIFSPSRLLIPKIHLQTYT